MKDHLKTPADQRFSEWCLTAKDDRKDELGNDISLLATALQCCGNSPQRFFEAVEIMRKSYEAGFDAGRRYEAGLDYDE